MIRALALAGSAYLFFFAQGTGACLMVSYTARCFGNDMRVVAAVAAFLVVIAFWWIERRP